MVRVQIANCVSPRKGGFPALVVWRRGPDPGARRTQIRCSALGSWTDSDVSGGGAAGWTHESRHAEDEDACRSPLGENQDLGAARRSGLVAGTESRADLRASERALLTRIDQSWL